VAGRIDEAARIRQRAEDEAARIRARADRYRPPQTDIAVAGTRPRRAPPGIGGRGPQSPPTKDAAR
jgi:hypothetical protein